MAGSRLMFFTKNAFTVSSPGAKVPVLAEDGREIGTAELIGDHANIEISDEHALDFLRWACAKPEARADFSLGYTVRSVPATADAEARPTDGSSRR